MKRSLDAWREAVARDDSDLWIEHLDRIELSDHFPFLWNQDVLTVDGKSTEVHSWINFLGGLTQSELHGILNESRRPAAERLAVATFVRWNDRLRRLLMENEAIPNSGVLQYFSDDLAVGVLVGYRRPGSTVVIEDFLAFPEPDAFLDPLSALNHARTDQELELLRRALFSRHKVAIHRNVLTHIDREVETQVFGPSIDTLLLNEWLFTNRYLPQRTLENARYFEELIAADLARESEANGSRFLEIGSGNGLLTATFAKNEAKIQGMCAIDISMAAITATFRNSYRQRKLPRGGVIGDRAKYIVSRYDKDTVPTGNDLVVCNPPYIPATPEILALPNLHPLTRATVGTDLLQSVIGDAPKLLSSQGQLLLIASDLAEQEVMNAVPKGFVASKLMSKKVPFDVGPVRGNREILKWLKTNRGLGGGGRRGYTHQVSLFSISETPRRRTGLRHE